MKKIIVVAALATLTAGAAMAQQPFKFGHINGQEVLMLMSERDSAEAKYMAYGKDLEEMLENMQVEFNKMYQEYQQKSRTWSDAIRESKEKDLQDKQRRIQEFQATAAEDLQKRQRELLSPVVEKATGAIKKVAKDNGFTYVFDTSNSALAYYNEEQSINIMDLVKKELKIPAGKVAPAAAPR